jgi:OmcA/MtrC family decaheme c-type cytochrome
MRNWLLVGAMSILVACGGGGGGNSAKGVESGPPPPGGSVPPPEPEFPETNPSPYAEAEELFVFITDVTLNSDNQAVVQFRLTDGDNVPIIDLEIDDIRFVISKLQGSLLGNLTGTWQSYINQIEKPNPDVGTGTEQRLQATYERSGEFDGDNGDGTYMYTYSTSLTNLDPDILAQAETEGLNLDYEPDRTHRVAIQFDGAPGKANPNYDWIPATGATAADGIFTMDIAATENCNRCHDPLAIHGGGRREVKYCVTCHNAGSTDANSTNTVDLKVMVHKIHMGKHLPSVIAGGEYAIYGFRNSKHDYSELGYPQDIRNCVNCHVGTGTVGDRKDLTVTSQGDNWAQVPSAAACGSCHDDVLGPDDHIGSKPDDSGCASCHSLGGRAGSVEYSHRIELEEARKTLKTEILNVDNSMPGEQAVVTFRISNPLDGDKPYDIMNDPIFTASDARLAVGVAWNTTDYTNTGNFDKDTESNNASQVQADALADATANGDGSYSITMPVAIPNGTLPPWVAASGSGVATVEGHPIIELDQNNDGTDEPTSVPVVDARALDDDAPDASEFFSIDESDGNPVPRRKAVELGNCLACHSTLILHGSNRADDIDSCTSCHNPRNTDRRVRELGRAQATDGKDEESLDFKTMVHGIHAASKRENALQIVGFGGFSVHVYDEEEVHYPGNLANCTTCHTEDGFRLPLASGVLATSNDTGDDVQDPADDTVTTPITAVCSSCHDRPPNISHMEFYDGNFNTTQKAIDNGEVVEQCNTCHATGKPDDAWEAHQTWLN